MENGLEWLPPHSLLAQVTRFLVNGGGPGGTGGSSHWALHWAGSVASLCFSSVVSHSEHLFVSTHSRLTKQPLCAGPGARGERSMVEPHFTTSRVLSAPKQRVLWLEASGVSGSATVTLKHSTSSLEEAVAA